MIQTGHDLLRDMVVEMTRSMTISQVSKSTCHKHIAMCNTFRAHNDLIIKVFLMLLIINY
jgi:hypothetical protein